MGHKTKIAYLAPEIPALSATFVYNEILVLEEKGFEILPLSVHVPASIAKEKDVEAIRRKTRYLYREIDANLLIDNAGALLKSPIRYLRTLGTALSDALSVGLFSRTGRGILYRFLVASRVVGLLKGEGCSHLHAHFAHIPTDIAMYASRLSGVPFSFTSHANDLFERGWLLKEKVARSLFAATISDHNRRFLADQGADERKIHIVRCGVDSRAFTPREEKPLGSPPKIGALGRMVEKKGFDVLIRACGILKNKGVPLQVEIAGDGTMLEALRELVLSLDLSTTVSFPGPLSHDEVPVWLKGLDLFALPCRKDGHGDMDGVPVVLMEAMLSGIPVVSTRLSGIPELIEDEQTGCLADPDDPEGFASAISQVLSDAPLRRQLRKNATEKVRSEFDLSKNVAKLSNLFRKETA